MGLVHFGVPHDLVLSAKERFGIRTFVETGTFRGDTAAFAAEHFQRVHTIEFVPERHQQARQRLAKHSSVSCLCGNSPEVLRQIAPTLRDAPTLFWLDAHWNGDGQSREFECPVLEEVRAINEADLDAFILVDDARLFLAPPPAPHDAAQWPSLAALVPLLAHGGKRSIIIVDDVICAWPLAAQSFLIDYAHSRPQPWTTPAPVGGGIFYVSRQDLPPVTVRGGKPP